MIKIWVGLLPAAVLIANLFALALLYAYSQLNLRPFLPAHETVRMIGLPVVVVNALLFLLPTVASVVFLRPVFRWAASEGSHRGIPPKAVKSAANAPVALSVFTAAVWGLISIITLLRAGSTLPALTAGLWAHFFVRPILTGMIATTAVYFAGEFICRWKVWPVVYANRTGLNEPGTWRVGLLHRLIMFWTTISFLPLSVVALIAYVRVEETAVAADPIHAKVMYAMILIGSSAALGGACLAWVLARTIAIPLRRLERAMEDVRDDDLEVRVAVGSHDEVGALERGFNEMTERIAKSYQALERKNQELVEALDKVAYLEAVKRGLDRFVPDTVRRLIEENPQSPALQKSARDVTVLFLDIQGYTALSEALAPGLLNEIVENYFSMYLADIRAAGGDINETAGDGLMIIFQNPFPLEHAASAVRVALAIREKTSARNLEGAGKHPALAINMGVASGECEVGSTKFRATAGERWTFTASGPSTNLAARLGDLARDGQILVGPETAKRVHGRFLLRPIGPVELKNIGRPIEVWEVKAAM